MASNSIDDSRGGSPLNGSRVRPAGPGFDLLNTPAVSIVIPCYRQASFLPEAIESVLSQSFQDFEVVVVDDGSPDETSLVALRFERVRLVRQSNQGLSGARNTGFRESRAPYVLFLDADDRLPPDALEAGIRCARAHSECGLVWGQYRMLTAGGSPIARPPTACPTEEAYLALLRRNCIGMNATVLFRRDALEAVGGFDRSLAACEDYDAYLKIARVFSTRCHETIVAEYRWHHSNMSRDFRRMLRAAIRVLRRQRKHVRGRPAYERAYREGLREWRKLYGVPLVNEALRRLITGEGRWRAVAQLVLLLQYDPAGLFRRLVRRRPPIPTSKFR